MSVYSKLPYSCYDIGHCWTPSCSTATFEVCIIGFIESCKIYAVVYLLTALIEARKLNVEYGRKLLKDYVQSVCFLTVNAFGYIGSFCVVRHIIQHVNILTASFLPGVIGSLMAINVERPTRRPMLAIYVTNVASECLWNSAVCHGYVKPIPRGEVFIFAAAMAVLGYSFRSSSPLSRMITSILQLFLGRGESGVMITARQTKEEEEEKEDKDTVIEAGPKRLTWVERFLSMLKTRHPSCPHRAGCLPYFTWTALRGFAQGFLLQLSMKVLPSLPRFIRSPRMLLPILLSKNNIRAGLFLAWFTSVFKGVCCGGRWWSGKDRALHGAIAGFLSGLSMYFYSAPSIALYVMWKTVESLYGKGCDKGYLPRLPGSVALLYSVSTGYLFHMAAVEKHNMKPSYWRFLKRLTWNRMAEYNRHLLSPFGFDSGHDFQDYWPDYDSDHISEHLKKYLAEAQMETSL